MTIRPRCYSVTWREGDQSGAYCTCWGAHPNDIEHTALKLATSLGHAKIEAGHGMVSVFVSRTWCDRGETTRARRERKAREYGTVAYDYMHKLPRSLI